MRQLPYQALAVGEDRTREAEVVQRLEAPRDGEELHKGRRTPLVGAEADRSERVDENGAACPLLIRRHDDQAAPPRMGIPRVEVVVCVWRCVGVPGAVGVDAPVPCRVQECCYGVRPVEAGWRSDLIGVHEVGEDVTDLMWMRKGDNDPSVSPVGEVPGAGLDCATDGPDPLS